jgi:outer membrane receptor protein involved in Fe transport
MMFMKQKLALAITLALSNVAMSQSIDTEVAVAKAADQETDLIELNRITVTGGKLVRDLQSTTSGISVVDAEQLQANNTYELSDALVLTPNARTNGRGGFSIRGINAEGGPTSDTSTADTASIIMDGAYFDADLLDMGLSLWDVENIEVYKGPQSTSQGKNALAGTIVVKSNDPAFDTQGSVRLGVGSDNTQISSVMYNQGLSDKLAVRIAAERTYTDGQITNLYTGKDDEAKNEHTNGRIKLLFKPSEDFEALLTLGQDEVESGDNRSCGSNNTVAGVFTCNEGDFTAYRDVIANNHKKLNYQTLKLQKYFSDTLSFTSITSHSSKTVDVISDADSLAPTNSDYINAGNLGTRNEHEEDESLNQELRVTFDNGTVRSSLGYYYGKSEEVRGYDFTLANPLDAYLPNFYAVTGLLSQLGAVAPYTNGKSDTVLTTEYVDEGSAREATNHALFMEADWKITKATTALFGLRAEYERNLNTAGITATNTNTTDIEAINSHAGAYFNTLTTASTYSTYWQQLGLSQAPTAQEAEQYAQATFAQFTPYLTAGGVDISGGAGAINFQPGDLNQMLNTLAAQASNTAHKDTTHKVLLPKLGIRHEFSDSLSTGYVVSRGYRSGGISLNPTGVEAVVEYDPEFVTNHEMSVRSQWLDNRLTLNGNLYYMKWEDQQVQAFGTTGSVYDRYITNAGSSTLKGAELDVNYRADIGVSVFANMAVAKTRYEDFVVGSKDFSGNQFQYAPEKTGAVGVGFDQGLGINAFLIASYTGSSYLNNENTRQLNSYVVTNFRVGYTAIDWQISAYINNLLDTEGSTYEYSYADYSADFDIYGDYNILVPERSFGLVAQYNF